MQLYSGTGDALLTILLILVAVLPEHIKQNLVHAYHSEPLSSCKQSTGNNNSSKANHGCRLMWEILKLIRSIFHLNHTSLNESIHSLPGLAAIINDRMDLLTYYYPKYSHSQAGLAAKMHGCMAISIKPFVPSFSTSSQQHPHTPVSMHTKNTRVDLALKMLDPSCA